MFNSESQTYVLTSETLQIFVLLPDLCKIPFLRKLFLLKKTSTEKGIFEKGQKRAAIFSWRLQLRYCKIYQKTTSLIQQNLSSKH